MVGWQQPIQSVYGSIMSDSTKLPATMEQAEAEKKTGIQSRIIPFEERESQKPKFTNYLKSTFSVFGYILLGAITGGLLGKALESKNIGFGPFQRYGRFFGRTNKIDTQLGLAVGLKAGLVVGIYRNWKDSEGKRLGIKEISGDLMPAMDASHLASEVKREQAILDDLHVVQKKLEPHVSPSHTEREATRRATATQQELQP